MTRKRIHLCRASSRGVACKHTCACTCHRARVSYSRSTLSVRPASSISPSRLPARPSLFPLSLLLAPSLLRFEPEVLGVRDCLSRPAVSKANDLPWNLDNLSARLQPLRPGLHLFCTRVCVSLSFSFSFLVCSVSFRRSVSFLRSANRIEGVLTRPLGDH